MLNSRSSSAAFHLGKSTPFSNLLALYSLNFFEKRKTLGAAALEKFFFFLSLQQVDIIAYHIKWFSLRTSKA